MKSRATILNVLTAAILLAMASSCGSSRRAVSRGKGQASVADNVVSVRKPDAGKKNPRENKQLIDDVTKAIINEAYTWLGTRYVYGGHARNGTDCSGMIMEIFLKVMNLKLPRSSKEQQAYCAAIERGALRPGDLIFFRTGRGPEVSHVGLYIGDNQMIHASSSRGVVVSNIFDDYYVRHYHSSGHIMALNNYAAPSNEVKTVIVQLDEVKEKSSLHILDLEDAINQKTDSIFNSFMD